MGSSNTEIEYQTVEYILDYDTLVNYIATNIYPVDDPAQQLTIMSRTFTTAGQRDAVVGKLRPGDALVVQFKVVDGPTNVA